MAIIKDKIDYSKGLFDVFKTLTGKEVETFSEKDLRKLYIQLLDNNTFDSLERFNEFRVWFEDELDRLYHLRYAYGIEEGNKIYKDSFKNVNLPEDAFVGIVNTKTDVSYKEPNNGSYKPVDLPINNDNSKNYVDDSVPLDLVNNNKKDNIIYLGTNEEVKVDNKKLRVNEKALKRKKKLKIVIGSVVAVGIIVASGYGAVKLNDRANYVNDLNSYYETCDTEISYVVGANETINGLERQMKIENIEHIVNGSVNSLDTGEALYVGDIITAKVPKEKAEKLVSEGKAIITQEVNENEVNVELNGRTR